jgi:hypothetical protein
MQLIGIRSIAASEEAIEVDVCRGQKFRRAVKREIQAPTRVGFHWRLVVAPNSGKEGVCKYSKLSAVFGPSEFAVQADKPGLLT